MSERARAHKTFFLKNNNNNKDNNTALTLKQTEAVFFLWNLRCYDLLWDALIAAEYVAIAIEHLKVNCSYLTGRNFQILARSGACQIFHAAFLVLRSAAGLQFAAVPMKTAAARHPVLRITTTTQCFTTLKTRCCCCWLAGQNCKNDQVQNLSFTFFFGVQQNKGMALGAGSLIQLLVSGWATATSAQVPPDEYL